MKRQLNETNQLIELARRLNRRATTSWSDGYTPRCPICQCPMYAVMTRTGPRFLCSCKKGA